MTADESTDDGEVGYDPGVDRGADPHGPAVGEDAVRRDWGQLAAELTSAESVRDLVGTVERYGWAPPLAGLALHGVVRGGFEHLVDPYAMSQGYAFPGWELALAINVVYGFFLVAFAWFLYFGLVGALAGLVSEARSMDVAVFKVGGYLTVLFLPVFLVAIPIVLTIPAPETAADGGSVDRVRAATQAVYRTPQMQLVGVLKAVAWTVTGLVMLPVVGELYDVDQKGSVFAVLPVTLAAVVSTQLL